MTAFLRVDPTMNVHRQVAMLTKTLAAHVRSSSISPSLARASPKASIASRYSIGLLETRARHTRCAARQSGPTSRSMAAANAFSIALQSANLTAIRLASFDTGLLVIVYPLPFLPLPSKTVQRPDQK